MKYVYSDILISAYNYIIACYKPFIILDVYILLIYIKYYQENLIFKELSHL